MRYSAPTPKDPNTRPNDISILESSTSFRYNASLSYNETVQARYVQRFAAPYVTGSHALKMGIQVQEGVMDLDNIVNGDLTYTFLRGVPNSLTQFATLTWQSSGCCRTSGLFVQDQWAMKRVTLNAGLRFDSFRAYVPAQHVPATQFVPIARDFEVLSDIPNWKDVNPRLGLSYDPWGNGARLSRRPLADMSARQRPAWLLLPIRSPRR